MEQSQLFYITRLRLASWYAGVMGCILSLCGLGVYHVVAHAYRETIDQGLQSVAVALHHSIEPGLQQPNYLPQLAQQLSLEICVPQADCLPRTPLIQSSLSEAVYPVNYYLRLLNRAEKPIALGGLQLKQLPISLKTQRWQTLKDPVGIDYRQISLPLRTQNTLWGYIQVGRSLTDLNQHLAALKLTLLLGCPIALILIAWSSWWLAGLAMQPVYRSYQQMQQFTADAAHEFRTPLTAMQSTIEAAIRLQGLGEAPSSVLTTLKRQTNRLSQLVADLLLLARIEGQEMKIKSVPCCLNDLISDLAEELAFLAVEANVKLLTQTLSPEPLYVGGKEEQLYRLVSNLIVNGIQATPEGGEVRIILERLDQQAVIAVKDTGIGIASEDLTRIFDRFYRVHRDRSRQTGGSGLGLAIAQAITQAHHGSISLHSQPGKGSTFTVRLPLEKTPNMITPKPL